MRVLKDGGIEVPEISISFENGVEKVHNNDIDESLKMMIKVLDDLKEGIDIYIAINDYEPCVIRTDFQETERDIRLMQDMADEMIEALQSKKYLKDNSVLPMLTIKGSILALEVIQRSFDREDIEDNKCAKI